MDYLMIDEEGETSESDVFTDADKFLCEQGLLSVIFVGGSGVSLEYVDGSWEELLPYKRYT